jgi:hypothetical protein
MLDKLTFFLVGLVEKSSRNVLTRLLVLIPEEVLCIPHMCKASWSRDYDKANGTCSKHSATFEVSYIRDKREIRRVFVIRYI